MQKTLKKNLSYDTVKVLNRKLDSLKNFVEFSTLISSELDFSELMTLVMEKAKRVMDAEACSILFYNRETDKLEFEIAISEEQKTSDILKEKIVLDMGQGIAGWVAKNMKPIIIKDVSKDKRFFQEADKKTGFITKSLIAVPLVGRRGLIGVAEIINPKNEEYDFEIFQILTKQFATAIENALFYKESLEREKLRQQLEIASALQESFLPEHPTVKKGNIMVSAVNISAAKVGGDIYDFLDPSKSTVGIFIGDVSGKGISAALYMAKIISDFRYIAHTIFSPELVFDRLNAQLMRAPRGMFLTACYMIVDVMSGKARFAVAGHPPFLLVTKNEVKAVPTSSGPPLGIVGEHYTKESCFFQSGDRVILVTDGVFEAKNKKGKRIGFEKIIRLVEKYKDKENLLKRITDHIEKFSKGTERADDLTLVEVRFL
jgi:sigma-B regulation protein RsbU (phosphoserine phosphatase)